jgi:hypothetical protein
LGLSSNTDDDLKKKYFLEFLSEARKAINSLRSMHRSIPIYNNNTYELKGKISIYTILPIEPPKNISILPERKEIPKRNKYNELVFEDYLYFKPNVALKEVINLGSFGCTYFRSILSGIRGKKYKNVWKEFPKEWFEDINIERYLSSLVIQKEVNKYGAKMGGNLDMWEYS